MAALIACGICDADARGVGAIGQVSEFGDRDVGLPNTLAIGQHRIVFAAEGQGHDGADFGRFFQREAQAVCALRAENTVFKVEVFVPVACIRQNGRTLCVQPGDGVVIADCRHTVKRVRKSVGSGCQVQAGVVSPYAQVVCTIGLGHQDGHQPALRHGQIISVITGFGQAVFEPCRKCGAAHHNDRVAHLAQHDVGLAGDVVTARCASVRFQTQLR